MDQPKAAQNVSVMGPFNDEFGALCRLIALVRANDAKPSLKQFCLSLRQLQDIKDSCINLESWFHCELVDVEGHLDELDSPGSDSPRLVNRRLRAPPEHLKILMRKAQAAHGSDEIDKLLVKIGNLAYRVFDVKMACRLRLVDNHPGAESYTELEENATEIINALATDVRNLREVAAAMT
jgi:hypothetical protein